MGPLRFLLVEEGPVDGDHFAGVVVDGGLADDGEGGDGGGAWSLVRTYEDGPVFDPMHEVFELDLAGGNAQRYLDDLAIDAHLITVQLQEETAGFHTGAFVAIMKDMTNNNAPGDGSGLLHEFRIRIVTKKRTLDCIEHVLQRPRVGQIMIAGQEDAPKLGDHTTVYLNNVGYG